MPTGKVYIGSSANMAHRCDTHIKRLTAHKHENSYLQNAWDKYGADAFEFVVVEIVAPALRIEREQYWLDTIQPYDRCIGFNVSLSAAAPMAGRKHSEVTRNRLRETSSRYRHSEDTKRMMSERNKGKVFGVQTEESLRKRSIAATGRKHKPETIQKMRAARLKSNPAIRSYTVTFPGGTQEVITNLSQFCRDNQLSEGSMRNIASGKTGQKWHKGYSCCEVRNGVR